MPILTDCTPGSLAGRVVRLNTTLFQVSGHIAPSTTIAVPSPTRTSTPTTSEWRTAGEATDITIFFFFQIIQ